MTPEQIEEIIQHNERVTFLLGTVLGEIGVILRNIENNNVDKINGEFLESKNQFAWAYMNSNPQKLKSLFDNSNFKETAESFKEYLEEKKSEGYIGGRRYSKKYSYYKK